MAEHHSQGEEKIIGVTHDPVLRPIGILMAVVGATWALFTGMALEAGTYGQPLAAVGLMALGVIIAGTGKPTEQI
jgi:formate-dependent nitrite reductase membrane component NrfD